MSEDGGKMAMRRKQRGPFARGLAKEFPKVRECIAKRKEKSESSAGKKPEAKSISPTSKETFCHQRFGGAETHQNEGLLGRDRGSFKKDLIYNRSGERKGKPRAEKSRRRRQENVIPEKRG